ncbi:ribonuclease P protein component [uncultured Parolsenella sp.]|uniref:ribonuclease P protein component n=1 Tax=uncultured Parolsenella sp. TaxID=2083008 RepID=UPI0027DD44F9|nr:ribonuclease P protein component [uncultured Parolsenella sp.]
MKTIKSKRDFERVFRGGRRINHPLVRLTVSPVEEDAGERLAFVAAKRIGNAVCRNRCKRVLRAAAREAGFPPKGYEVILFATNATRTASPSEVAAALGKLARRIHV